MPKYEWPEKSKRTLLGTRVSRLDGPEKVSGKAKYASDIKRPGQLYAKSFTNSAVREKRRTCVMSSLAFTV